VNVARSKERRKWERRERRSNHVGNKIFGTPERPRLSVYRSNKHFHSQLIDDGAGRTLAAASTLSKDLKGQIKNGGDVKAAKLVGAKLAEAAKSKGITSVVFDRNFYRFHGRVRAFAEAAAAGGLKFLVNEEKGPKAPKAPKAKTAAPVKAEKVKKPRPEGAGKPPEGAKSDASKKESK
jgi:large subunit ribosomal protein L18